jgi:hypothetical protein
MRSAVFLSHMVKRLVLLVKITTTTRFHNNQNLLVASKFGGVSDRLFVPVLFTSKLCDGFIKS